MTRIASHRLRLKIAWPFFLRRPERFRTAGEGGQTGTHDATDLRRQCERDLAQLTGRAGAGIARYPSLVQS